MKEVSAFLISCQAKIYVHGMSAIGFSTKAETEIEQLRAAYSSLNDITRNLVDAEKCIKKQDLRLAEAHLRAAQWHALVGRGAFNSTRLLQHPKMLASKKP